MERRIENAAKTAVAGLLLPDRKGLVEILAFHFNIALDNILVGVVPKGLDPDEPLLMEKLLYTEKRIREALISSCEARNMEVDRRWIRKIAAAAAGAAMLPELEDPGRLVADFGRVTLSGIPGAPDPDRDPDGLEELIPRFEAIEKEIHAALVDAMRMNRDRRENPEWPDLDAVTKKMKRMSERLDDLLRVSDRILRNAGIDPETGEKR